MTPALDASLAGGGTTEFMALCVPEEVPESLHAPCVSMAPSRGAPCRSKVPSTAAPEEAPEMPTALEAPVAKGLPAEELAPASPVM